MIKTALISVSDKEGIVDFAKELSGLGIKIISTGNTSKLLKKNSIENTHVSKITKFPEMMGGRVKTIHPNIFGAILADRSNKEHVDSLKKLGIRPIDMVVVNFYPFEETIKRIKDINEILENIDIGGPSLVRAAAKNHKDVLVVIDPNDYKEVIGALRNKKIDEKFRSKYAAKAFLETGRYDAIISRYFSAYYLHDEFTPVKNYTFRKIMDLRYGENPDQKAAFYRAFWVKEACVSIAKKLQGKELSYNNILDASDAFELVKEFDEPTAAIIKHTNPSGVATADSTEEAYKKAFESDMKSAFGSIVALNRNCNRKTAEQMKKLFVEVVIAPKFEKDALDVFKTKKNLRLLETGHLIKDYEALDFRAVSGGLLIQTRQRIDLKEKDMKVVTKRRPTREELDALKFAFKVNKHVKSNSIVLARGNCTVGIGAGQMSRVDAVKLAIMKSEGKCKGSVMSSDAFFPFRDGVDEAAKAGVAAIIQPGGSVRDEEVIQAADEHNMAMVFTGKRLFWH